MGNCGSNGTLPQAEIPGDGNGPAARSIAVEHSHKAQLGMFLQGHVSVAHRQFHPFPLRMGATVQQQYPHPLAAFPRGQQEVLRAGDAGYPYGVCWRQGALVRSVLEHVCPFQSGQLATDKHGIGPRTIQPVQQLHVRQIPRGDGAQVIQAIFPGGIPCGQLIGLQWVHAAVNQPGHGGIHVALVHQILCMYIVGADGYLIQPAHAFQPLGQLFQPVHNGAGP